MCKKEKDGFYKSSKNLDGLDSYCKKCRSKYNSDWGKKNPRIYRERYIKSRSKRNNYSKKYYENNKDRILAIQKRNYEENKEKFKAHGIVKRAIKSNNLKQKSCIVCGDKKVDAHHEDYSKPLEVIWLCRTHHFHLHENILSLSRF